MAKEKYNETINDLKTRARKKIHNMAAGNDIIDWKTFDDEIDKILNDLEIYILQNALPLKKPKE